MIFFNLIFKRDQFEWIYLIIYQLNIFKMSIVY